MPELQESKMGQSEVGLQAMPSVSLQALRTLPNCSAVYFVSDTNWRVLYVGSSKCLILRWLRHNKLEQLVRLEACRVSWLETPKDDLLAVEGEYIKTLLPPLNTRPPAPHGTVKVRLVGGCLMIAFPQAIVRELGLKAGDEVVIGIQGGTMTVEHAKQPKGKTR